jgi:hypothetical protein
MTNTTRLCQLSVVVLCSLLCRGAPPYLLTGSETIGHGGDEELEVRLYVFQHHHSRLTIVLS